MALLVFILLPIILPIIIILFSFKEYKAKSSESSSSKNRKYKYAFITFVAMEVLEVIVFFQGWFPGNVRINPHANDSVVPIGKEQIVELSCDYSNQLFPIYYTVNGKFVEDDDDRLPYTGTIDISQLDIENEFTIHAAVKVFCFYICSSSQTYCIEDNDRSVVHSGQIIDNIEPSSTYNHFEESTENKTDESIVENSPVSIIANDINKTTLTS